MSRDDEVKKLVKPCQNCSVPMMQSMVEDEVTCYKECELFAEWQNKRVEAESQAILDGAPK